MRSNKYSCYGGEVAHLLGLPLYLYDDDAMESDADPQCASFSTRSAQHAADDEQTECTPTFLTCERFSFNFSLKESSLFSNRNAL